MTQRDLKEFLIASLLTAGIVIIGAGFFFGTFARLLGSTSGTDVAPGVLALFLLIGAALILVLVHNFSGGKGK